MFKGEGTREEEINSKPRTFGDCVCRYSIYNDLGGNIIKTPQNTRQPLGAALTCNTKVKPGGPWGGTPLVVCVWGGGEGEDARATPTIAGAGGGGGRYDPKHIALNPLG